MKYLIYILLSIFLFSCNGISDEEMEIRLAELELMQLANTHLEEDIDGLIMGIHGEMVLPQNKKTYRPLIKKISYIESLKDTLEIIYKSKNIDYLIAYSSNFYQSILDTIASDSLNQIHFEGKIYIDTAIEYQYYNFKTELDKLYQNQSNFLTYLKNPSDFEWQEIIELSNSYILLSQKKSLIYLIQLYVRTEYNLSSQINTSIVIPENHFYRNEKINFTVNITIPKLTNFSIMNYSLDDSLIYDKQFFNTSFIDSIKIPTSKLGKHQIKGTKYVGKKYNQKSEFNFTYNYEVIENK